MFQAFKAVVGRFQLFIRHQEHADALFQLNHGDFVALFVQQKAGNFHWYLAMHRCRAFFVRFFLNDAQNLQGARFGVADMAGAAATRARNRSTFSQRWAQALAAHFHQAKFADGAKLHTSTVGAQGVAQAVFHFAAVARLFHVDEVDDDQAA